MKKNKIIHILKTLDDKDLKELNKYLQTMYSGKKALPKVLNYLRKFHPEYNSPKLKKEIAFKSIFGLHEQYNYDKLMRCLADLYDISKEFIIWKENKLNSFEKEWILLNHYRRTKAEGLYNQLWKDVYDRYGKDQEAGNYYKMKLHSLSYFSSPFHDPRSEESKNNIANTARNLDLFYINNKLKYSNELLSRENILKEQHEHFLLNTILRNIDKFQNDKSIHLKLGFHKLIKNPSEKHFLNLVIDLFENWKSSSQKENHDLISYLLNYCTGQMVGEKLKEYLNHSFRLFKFGDEHDLFLDENQISYTKFNNAINIACNCGKLEWADNFIEKWQHYLPKEGKDELIKVAESQVDFYRGSFYKVVIRLHGLKFYNNLDLNLRARTLLLKSYVEVNFDYEEMFNFCVNFETFIRRKKKDMTINLFETHKNFVSLTKKLISIGNSNIQFLEEEVKSQKKCTSKSWILEKIREKKRQ